MASVTTSCASFQSILDAALDSYAKQTGVDLTKHASADKLQSLRSPEDVVQLLRERETAFKDYRDKHRQLIDCLRSIVQVVHAFSGTLGEAAGLVSSRHSVHLVLSYLMPPHRCHFNRPKRYLWALMFSSRYASSFPFSSGSYVIFVYIRRLLASVRVMTHYLSSSNASPISLDAFISTPRRSCCHLRCQI